MIDFSSHPQWPAVQFVADRLRSRGYQALLAGGCVRDALLGRSPKDFDIATDALPDVVETLFAKALTVGKQFGVIVVPASGYQIEVATFRKDLDYRDGRRPSNVVFSTAQEDAARRDFTVNALFYDLETKEILDFVGGQDDLKLKLIRAVGEPAERFQEDKLRLLRAVRFESQLGFELEAQTKAALFRFTPEIRVVSAERIRDEMTKLLQGRWRVRAVQTLKEAGLISVLFPELDACLTSSWTQLIERLKRVGELPTEGLWSLFLLDLSKLPSSAVKKSLEWLKFSNRELEAIVFVLGHIRKISTQAEWARHELMRFLAQPWTRVLLDVYATQNPLSAKWYRAQAERLLGEQGALPEAFLKGADLKLAGFKPGPAFGSILERAYNLQLDGVLKNREQALAWLKD